MRRRNDVMKSLSFAAVVLIVCGLTLGYAALTQTLNINFGATVQSGQTTWDIHFEESTKSAISEGNAVLNSVSLTKTTLTSSVLLKTEGDSLTYYVNVVNDGELDAMIDTITLTTPSATGGTATENANILNAYAISLQYSDGTNVGYGDTLLADETKEMAVTIYLKQGITLPETDVTISNIGCTITYKQKSGSSGSDDSIVQNPTNIGCNIGETVYGVTKTIENTLCWDGDITKYPTFQNEGGNATVNGEEVAVDLIYVKVSSKVITSANYDGSEYLLQFLNPGNTSDFDTLLTSDGYTGTGTGKDIGLELTEESAIWGLNVISTTGTLTDSFGNVEDYFLSAGTWFLCIVREDNGEIIFYPKSLTIPGMDFTGTSTRYEEMNEGAEFTSSTLKTAYFYNCKNLSSFSFIPDI